MNRRNQDRLDNIKRETEWLLRRVTFLNESYKYGTLEAVDVQIYLMDNFKQFQKVFKPNTKKLKIL